MSDIAAGKVEVLEFVICEFSKFDDCAVVSECMEELF
jgi:hypothetical protein